MWTQPRGNPRHRTVSQTIVGQRWHEFQRALCVPVFRCQRNRRVCYRPCHRRDGRRKRWRGQQRLRRASRRLSAGKYAKLAHTKEYVSIEEPIYGLKTLSQDGPVIITEGVADAIRAHEHGYACLSPVTTQFKKEHREELAEILQDTGRRTYIVQDAERPVVEYSEEADNWESLGIEQFGEGLKGAARTAAFLAQEGIDAYLAELPRIGVDKIDLDDYLGNWSDTLAPVLAGAKPGTQHPAYEVSTVGNSNDEFTDIGGGGIFRVHVRRQLFKRDSHTYDLTEAQVRDALECIRKTLSYDDWIQLGYAVHSWNDEELGKDVFTEWSKNHRSGRNQPVQTRLIGSGITPTLGVTQRSIQQSGHSSPVRKRAGGSRENISHYSRVVFGTSHKQKQTAGIGVTRARPPTRPSRLMRHGAGLSTHSRTLMSRLIAFSLRHSRRWGNHTGLSKRLLRGRSRRLLRATNRLPFSPAGEEKSSMNNSSSGVRSSA